MSGFFSCFAVNQANIPQPALLLLTQEQQRVSGPVRFDSNVFCTQGVSLYARSQTNPNPNSWLNPFVNGEALVPNTRMGWCKANLVSPKVFTFTATLGTPVESGITDVNDFMVICNGVNSVPTGYLVNDGGVIRINITSYLITALTENQDFITFVIIKKIAT